jgi:hypothetical protein
MTRRPSTCCPRAPTSSSRCAAGSNHASIGLGTNRIICAQVASMVAVLAWTPHPPLCPPDWPQALAANVLLRAQIHHTASGAWAHYSSLLDSVTAPCYLPAPLFAPHVCLHSPGSPHQALAPSHVRTKWVCGQSQFSAHTAMTAVRVMPHATFTALAMLFVDICHKSSALPVLFRRSGCTLVNSMITC